MTPRPLMIALALSGAAIAHVAPAQAPAYATAAVAATDRPAADTARDADRKPAAMIAFAGIKPGDKVADIIPGGGYFTRLFAKAVGPKGRVYAIVPAALAARNPKAADGVTAIAAEPGYKNVTVAVVPFSQVPEPGLLDVAWTSQNYHDIYNNDPAVATQFAKDIFAALKPGGEFVIIDHVATAGTDATAAKPLHRIDPALVKAQVIAAGFVLDGESGALANPADAHDKAVFDPSIRGHTDQFALKFKKPK